MDEERVKSDYEEYLANGYRFNLVVSILDVGLYFFGIHVLSAAIVLPAFMLRLGASDFLVALLPAVQLVGMRLPQVAVPFFVEGKRHLKPWILVMGTVQRLPWLLLIPLTLMLAESSPGVLLALFMLLFLAGNVGLGLSHPAWGDLIAKVIPEHLRGFMMGLNMMIGGGLGILGGFIVKYIMESSRFAYPVNYAALFLVASVIFWMSFGFFAMTREPLAPVAPRPSDLRSYFTSLADLLRRDRRLCYFLLYQVLFYSFVMGLGLFMAHAVRTFSLSDAMAGNFVLAATISLTVASPILGVVADRYGHRLVLAISALLYIAATLAAMMATSWRTMYAVFILSAVSQIAWIISMRNFVYTIAPPERRASYIALSGTIPAPFVLIFSMAGGWLSQSTPLGYNLPFGISVVLTAVALLVLVMGVRPNNQ